MRYQAEERILKRRTSLLFLPRESGRGVVDGWMSAEGSKIRARSSGSSLFRMRVGSHAHTCILARVPLVYHTRLVSHERFLVNRNRGERGGEKMEVKGDQWKIPANARESVRK